MVTKNQKVYFPNLNGLRFIASLLVLVYHLEQLKSSFDIPNYWSTVPFFQIVGKLGVVFFFVLSGFLISYLLFREESQFSKINIKYFYIRRLLRIWPLYFFIILLAFGVLPYLPIFDQPNYGIEVDPMSVQGIVILLMYMLFLPNLALATFGIIPYASHTWSIGTEEQFYLIWPLLLSRFKKHRLRLMALVIILYLIIKAFLYSQYADLIPYSSLLKSFWNTIPFDCMAIGGVFAILLYEKRKILEWLFHNMVFYTTLILLIILILNGIYIPYVHYEFYALLFGIVLINLAANKNIKPVLENRLFKYLGTISYGIYMYHPIGILLAIHIGLQTNITHNLVLYPLSLLTTILMAGISYKYIESYFLRKKDRYSKIKSGA